MGKKTFKDKTTRHLDRFFSEPLNENEEDRTHRTHDTHKTYEPHRTQIKPIDIQNDIQKYYRLNLKLKAEYKEYLDRISWENRKSITQYLNELIEADKATKDTLDTQDT